MSSVPATAGDRLVESQLTTPGIEGAHEKGGVEGEVGRFRRSHLVPVPEVADLAELNRLRLAGCEADLYARGLRTAKSNGRYWARTRDRGVAAVSFSISRTQACRSWER